MLRLGIGVLVGWLIFDETGRKVSRLADTFMKDKIKGAKEIYNEISKPSPEKEIKNEQ